MILAIRYPLLILFKKYPRINYFFFLKEIIILIFKSHDKSLTPSKKECYDYIL